MNTLFDTPTLTLTDTETELLEFFHEWERYLIDSGIMPVHTMESVIYGHFGCIPDEVFELEKAGKIKIGRTINSKYFKVI